MAGKNDSGLKIISFLYLPPAIGALSFLSLDGSTTPYFLMTPLALYIGTFIVVMALWLNKRIKPQSVAFTHCRYMLQTLSVSILACVLAMTLSFVSIFLLYRHNPPHAIGYLVFGLEFLTFILILLWAATRSISGLIISVNGKGVSNRTNWLFARSE
jgi:uncharacterized membrane protein